MVGLILLLTAVYIVLPVGQVRFGPALIGGVIATLLWEVIRHVLVWYFARLSMIRDGELSGIKAKMPEYETIFGLGSMLGNAHAGSLAKANDLCHLLGMDTIAMGVTLSFVAEALERGSST